MIIHLHKTNLKLLVRTDFRQIKFDCSRALMRDLKPIRRKTIGGLDKKLYFFTDKVSKSGVSIYYGKKVD